MYIYPNTTLKILHNVPLNNDYDHTIFFDGKIAQTEYFLSKAKYTLSNQSYQRKERGWINVDINQNNLWDCTYLMFQNTVYNNKWFYAFILSVDYVNDSVSKINFEIDVIQTWFFDFTVEKCFVEREHSSNDSLFSNTVPENLDVGLDYYSCESAQRELFDNTRIVVVSTTDDEGNPPMPVKHGNVFGGAKYATFTISDPYGSDIAQLRAYLNSFVSHGYEDNIVAIYQYPEFMDDITYHGYNHYTYNFTPNFSTISGYTPKNNKLFCYPYNYLIVSDKEGNAKEYKWEMWGNNHAGEFIIEGTPIGQPSVRICPLFYRSSSFQINIDESLSYDNFPICAWVGDSYQVWLAQNKGSLISQALTSGVGGALSIGAGVLTGSARAVGYGAAGLFGAIAGTLGRISDAKHMPKQLHGKLCNGILNMQDGSAGFDLKQMVIPYEYAQIVDEYFSRFGYASARVKVPNIYNATFPRKYWAYTKTIGCEIVGNIPSDDTVKIKSIFDNGVTFWNMYQLNLNNKSIGDYGDFTNPTM